MIPYTFDDPEDESMPSGPESGNDSASSLDMSKVSANCRATDFSGANANKGGAVFKSFEVSAKKLDTAADAIRNAADYLKASIEGMNSKKFESDSSSGELSEDSESGKSSVSQSTIVDKSSVPLPAIQDRPKDWEKHVDAWMREVKTPKADDKPSLVQTPKVDDKPVPVPVALPASRPEEKENSPINPLDYFAGMMGREKQAQDRSMERESKWESPSLVNGKDTGRDSIDAKLKKGEFVVRSEAVKAIGVPMLEQLNQTKQKPNPEKQHRKDPEYHCRGGSVGMHTPVAFRNPPHQPKAYAMGGGVGEFLANFAANLASENSGSASKTSKMLGTVGSVAGGPVAGLIGHALGSAVDTAVAAFKKVSDSATEAAKRLKNYDGALAGATARNTVRQITGDVQRARFLSPELSRFTEVTGKFSQTSQNIEAVFLKFGLKMIVPIMEGIQKLIDRHGEKLAEYVAKIIDALSAMAQHLEGIWGVGDAARDTAKFLDGIAQDIRDMNMRGRGVQKGIGMDEFMKAFLNDAGMNFENDVPRGNNAAQGVGVLAGIGVGAVAPGMGAGNILGMIGGGINR